MATDDLIWRECPDCGGTEGQVNDTDDVWIPCPSCSGQGGWEK